MKKSDEETLDLLFSVLFLFGMGLYQVVKAICKAISSYLERDAERNRPDTKEACPSLKAEPSIFHDTQSF